MSINKKPTGSGPWPVDAYHVGHVTMAGGTAADLAVLPWAAPGTRRRNVARSLITYRKNGSSIVLAILTTLEAQLVKVPRGTLFQQVARGLSPEKRESLERSDWDFFTYVALRHRPELADRLLQGVDGGPEWLGAFSKAGWSPDPLSVPVASCDNSNLLQG